MIRSYKYLFLESTPPPENLSIDERYEEHAASMGGYEANESYRSREAFFRHEFHDAFYGEIEFREEFLLHEMPSAPSSIVSIGAGRAALEARLIERGYAVLCTDLDLLPCMEETHRLFPHLEYARHDILEGPTEKKFEVLLALGLICLFDDRGLERFFRHAAGSIGDEGSLFVSGSSALDNIWSRLWFCLLLPLDAHLSTLVRRVFRGQNLSIVKKAHGYRHSSRELIAHAENAGFSLVRYKAFPNIADFRRSVFWDAFRNKIPGLIPASKQLSLLAPYSRMYHFRKNGPSNT